ncbi:MAG: hypothetical protein PHR56_02345 [Dehalococcoidales bacterium]|nr:hypothetical protein [Dehalococcoidales bacterium]
MNAPLLPEGRARFGYHIYWHVFLVHFPIVLFMTSAAFMVAHLFILSDWLEMASYVTLAAATLILLPTTITGWFRWKRHYQGIPSKTFIYKSRIAYGMIIVSVALLLLRAVFADTVHGFWHWAYGIGFVLLFIGALMEGFFGERLNHR